MQYNIRMEKELEVNNLKLSTKEQETLRLRIIRVAKKNLLPNGNVKAKLVAEICECSPSHVSHSWKKYCEEGVSAVKAVKMGRPKNSGKLTQEQQDVIKKLIVDKNPNQLKLQGFLWDRENVRDLIKRMFNEEIALQNISVYLRKWGMSPQRPIKQSYKQNPEEVQKWLEEEYPSIKERAKEENAEIEWGDETGCQNETNYVKGYAPVGQTPVLPVGNEHVKVNMISTISNKGKMRFMFYRGSMNAKVLIKFLRRLVMGTNRKIFLILDNMKDHHAILVQEWLKRHKEEIEIFYLPSYSPQHNPDEYLNGNLKRELAKKGYSKDADELESKARGTMKKLQLNTEHIKSFFQAEKVKYAA
jgi:transposase